MNQKWMIYNKKTDFYGLAEKNKVSPAIIKILRNRDIQDEEIGTYLCGNLNQLESPFLMKDMKKAIDGLMIAIEKKIPIRIISDYDVDGIMSNYILYRALSFWGGDVDYEIPDRKRDGYGLNKVLIQEAWQAGRQMIVTCDNGIAAAQEIQYANQLGMKVIVTDHHEVPFQGEGKDKKEIIPEAMAVVDAKQRECKYPFKELCGAGVAYALVRGMNEKMNNNLDLDCFLPYVAIATVCDVVSLTGENRILVKEGMRQLAKCQDVGLNALLSVNEIEKKQIKSYHFGFVVGPCLNAGGRLETAKVGLNLLLETDKTVALQLANNLVALNQKRKSMTNEAIERGKELALKEEYQKDSVLVIYLPDCHESIAGIVAGRLREYFYKPVFVITDGEQEAKGSGRSIESYSMFEKMSECRSLFSKFGGHPMAAGFSLPKDNIEELRVQLNEKSGLTKEMLTEKIMIDVAMSPANVGEDLIKELELLEPYGKDNEKPVFAMKDISLQYARVMGANRNVLKLTFLTEKGSQVAGIYFGEWETFLLSVKEREPIEYQVLLSGKKCNIPVSILYYPTINEYNGSRNVQLKLLGIK